MFKTRKISRYSFYEALRYGFSVTLKLSNLGFLVYLVEDKQNLFFGQVMLLFEDLLYCVFFEP